MSSSDFNKPITSDTYVNVPTEIKATTIDLALGLDPATTSPANIPTNAIRWNSANNYWEKFSGSAWSALTNTYAIIVSQAVKLKNAFTLSLSGDITGSASIDGSGNVTLTSMLASVNSNIGSYGSSTAIPTFTVNAKGQITAAGSTALNIISSLGYTPYNATNPNGYQTSSGSVSYATSSGSASYASSAPWSGISGKPSVTTWNWSYNGQGGQPSYVWGSNDGANFYVWNPSNFSVNYAATAGAAYPYRVGGAVMQFNWSGQDGQPSWLWGSNDGTKMYVYDPSNFSVNYANSSNYANSAGSAGSAGSANYANSAGSAGSAGNGVAGHSSYVDTWSDIYLTKYVSRITLQNGGYYDAVIYAPHN